MMKPGIKYTQFVGAVEEAPPDHPIVVVIAHCYRGSEISIDARWFKTMEEAKVEMNKIRANVKAAAETQGGRHTIKESLD